MEEIFVSKFRLTFQALNGETIENGDQWRKVTWLAFRRQ